MKSAVGKFPIVFLALFLMGISSFESLFIPSKKIWVYWIDHDPFSTATINHEPWSDLLERYLARDSQGLNRFNYAAVTGEDRESLRSYVDSLASIPIRRYRKDEQLAYWINLYNALTVSVVLDHYPVESIRDIDITPGLFGNGPWGKKLLTIEGEAVSLNDIEHRILRPIWDDPRLHYAVNCASVGCPNLRQSAFTGASVETMLEAAAREFINSPRAVWPKPEGIWVSSIYAWFQEDFGGDDAGILAHLRRYADDERLEMLRGVTEISNHDYNWRLNGASGLDAS